MKMIPKTIYQSWFTQNFHPKIEKNFKKHRSLNPDYEFVLYNDDQVEDFILANFDNDIIRAFKSLNIMTAKVDFWRYLILYKKGGVYLDIDSQINVKLDSFVRKDDEAIITAETNEGLFVQWALFFSKNHPILEKTINNVVENIQKRKFPNDIVNTTGPGVFTNSLKQIHFVNTNEKLVWEKINKKYDKTFEIINNNSISKYRIFGVDFNGKLSFKLKNTKHLYQNKNHWKVDERNVELYN